MKDNKQLTEQELDKVVGGMVATVIVSAYVPRRGADNSPNFNFKKVTTAALGRNIER